MPSPPELSFHVTPSKQSGSHGGAVTPLKTFSTASGIRVNGEAGRPDVANVITKASIDAVKGDKSVGVVVCGPKALSMVATKICHHCNVDVHVESFEY